MEIRNRYREIPKIRHQPASFWKRAGALKREQISFLLWSHGLGGGVQMDHDVLYIGEGFLHVVVDLLGYLVGIP